MLGKKVDFVKGHMGGDEIILLNGDKVPEGDEINYALSVLESPHVRGHQAGLLYRSTGENQLRVKIISVTGKNYISVCGGLTQVLGKALVETDFSTHFGIQIKEPNTKVLLDTDAGMIPLEIEQHNGTTRRTKTNMYAFVKECYKLGVKPMELEGVKLVKVGEALAINADEVREQYPNANFERMNESTLRILERLQKAFVEKVFTKKEEGVEKRHPGANPREKKYCTFGLYDLNPQHKGHGRVIFPHYIPTGHIEPACGTGIVAVGISMLKRGEIKNNKRAVKLLFESGGDACSIGGPELTELDLAVQNGEITGAYFSHDLVELLATGEIWG